MPPKLSRYSQKAELAYNQQIVFEGSNQIRQAYDAGAEYFAKPQCRVWDASHERLFKNTLRLSTIVMIAPDSALFTAVRLANTNPNNTLGDNIEEFLNMCDERMDLERERAKKELRECQSPLLVNIDLPHLLQESVVDASIEFVHCSYISILTKIVKIPRYEGLTHKILIRAFNFTVKYGRPEYHKEYITALNYLRSLNDNPKQGSIKRIIDTQLVAYSTSIHFLKYQRALEAINDAYINAVKYTGLSPQLEEKIEVAKLDILNLTNCKIFAAIQRVNLLDFYMTHPSIPPPMPLKEMLELAIIEAAVSPLLEEPSVNIDSINFATYLKQSSGVVPSHSVLLAKLLARSEKSPLTTFIHSAETETDPFIISDNYQIFIDKDSKKYKEDHIEILSQYAALSIIKRVRYHYDSISFYELGQFIPWMDHAPLEQLLVKASHSNIIPVHINMSSGYIKLVPRGSQELNPTMSTLNNQLKIIFEKFQEIQNEALQVQESKPSKEQIRRVYTRPQKQYNERPEKLRQIVKILKQEAAERRRREEEREQQRLKELEEIEQEKRKEEEMRNLERKRREDLYEYHYAECQIIADSLRSIDLKRFLLSPSKSGIKPTGKKSNDLEYIEEKTRELKIIYVEDMRSNADLIANRMSLIKDNIGKKRILTAYATKEKILHYGDPPLFVKEQALIPKLFKAVQKTNQKHYEEEMKEYLELKAKCESVLPQYTEITKKIAAQAASERPVRQQVAPSGYIPLAKRRELEAQSSQETISEDVNEQQEEEQEQEPIQNNQNEEEEDLEEKRRQEEEEARRKAEEEEAERKRKEEEERKRKEEEERKRKEEEERRKRAILLAKQKAAEEQKLKAELEAKKKAQAAQEAKAKQAQQQQQKQNQKQQSKQEDSEYEYEYEYEYEEEEEEQNQQKPVKKPQATTVPPRQQPIQGKVPIRQSTPKENIALPNNQVSAAGTQRRIQPIAAANIGRISPRIPPQPQQQGQGNYSQRRQQQPPPDMPNRSNQGPPPRRIQPLQGAPRISQQQPLRGAPRISSTQQSLPGAPRLGVRRQQPLVGEYRR